MLDKFFFERNAEIVAKNLLGKLLGVKINGKEFSSKIVETEAYFDEKDPASRACQNGDLRETMVMEGGTILVYGVHNNWMFNLVSGNKNEAQAVLIRAVEPLNFSLRCNGPGLLTKSLKIKKNFHKKSIIGNKEIWIENNDGVFEIGESYRIGVRNDLKKKMRFYIKGNRWVSGGKK